MSLKVVEGRGQSLLVYVKGRLIGAVNGNTYRSHRKAREHLFRNSGTSIADAKRKKVAQWALDVEVVAWLLKEGITRTEIIQLVPFLKYSCGTDEWLLGEQKEYKDYGKQWFLTLDHFQVQLQTGRFVDCWT